MPLPSKASKLPPALREALASLWFEKKYSLDQILEHLNALARSERSMLPPELASAPEIPSEAVPGRTGLYDYFKGASKAAEKIRRSRMAAEVVAKEFGDASDDKVARANFAMLHSAVNDLFMAAAEAEDNGGEEDGPPVHIDPKSAMMLASALQKIESAKKTHADLRTQIREEQRRVVEAEMRLKLDEASAKGGCDAEAAENARRILGFA